MLPLPQTAELAVVPTEFHTTDFAGVFPQMPPEQVRARMHERGAPTRALVPYDADRVEAFQRMMNDEGFVLELSRLL